jgi:hypothetical protein
VVDALNRRVHEKHATTISMHRTYLKDINLEVITTYQHYVQFKEIFQQNNVQRKDKDYKLEEDGILLFRNRVYVPNSRELRNSILKGMYDVPYVGHLGY